VEEAVRGYDRLLRAFRLKDEHVASAYPPHPVVRFVVRGLLRLLIHFPLAIVGTALNILPFYLVRAVAWIVRKSPDQVATYKVFGGLFLYPLTWIAESVLVTRWTGNGWLGALTFLAGPLTGYAALLFHEQRRLFWTESKAYLLLKTRKRLASELKERRDAVLQEVEALADLYLRETAKA
jgi:hypothetical protein